MAPAHVSRGAPTRPALESRGKWSDGTRKQGDAPNRVLRGGSWNNNANNARSANRNRNNPNNRNNNNGFRLASTGRPEWRGVRLPPASAPVQPAFGPSAQEGRG
jgi:hypothetical protein